MTAVARPASATAVASVQPAGDRGAKLRRRIAYILLIAYAIAMFIPFGWSVLTSFKTLPDSVRLEIIPPSGFTLDGWNYALTKLKPTMPVLFLNSAIIAVAVTFTNI